MGKEENGGFYRGCGRVAESRLWRFPYRLYSVHKGSSFACHLEEFLHLDDYSDYSEITEPY